MSRRLKSLVPGVVGISALGALVLVFLAGLFVEPGRWRLSSASLLQGSALFRGDPPTRSLGRASPAAALRSEPWSSFDRSEIRSGRAPLWNPWNGCGSPHLANAGAASLSPFALPGYLVGERAGAVVSAALELFLLALFAWLFLRELGTGVLAAVVGATAFAFAGANAHPLANGRAGALAALPAALFFVERTLRSVRSVACRDHGERRSAARIRGPLAGLCLTFALGSLGGSPAALALAAVVAFAWTAVRVVGIVQAARAAGCDLRPLVVAGSKVALALLLAAGLASFRILGWLELRAHAETATPLPSSPPGSGLAPWPLYFFPGALGGGPADAILPLHVGGLVLFLAIASLAFSLRDPRIPWFLAIALLCAAAATESEPVLRRLGAVGVPSDEAGQGGFALGLSCAAALAVDRIARSRGPRPWFSASLLAIGGLAFLALFRLGLERVPCFDASASAPELKRAAIAFAAGVVAVCLLGVARGRNATLVAGAGLVLSVFAAASAPLRASIPRCEAKEDAPWTDALRALRERVGTDRLLVVGDDALPAEANVPYEIALLTSRGGTEIASFARRFRTSFAGSAVCGPVAQATSRALQTFGVRWVLANDSFEPARALPDAFERVAFGGPLALYRFKGSLGRCWLVRRSVGATSAAQAFAFADDPAFDPARVVVLGPDGLEEEHASDPATRLEAALGARVADLATSADAPPRWTQVEPTWIRIEAECSAPEYLVLAQSWYPGWKARVNGIEAPLLRANAAFVAVELPSGLSVVEIVYEPKSIEAGLWIALASGIVGLWCLFRRPVA
jgi:hypothetical protein